MGSPAPTDPLAFAHAPTRAWFEGAFGAPTRAQALGWRPIAEGRSTVLLAPTGSGKTLAAFLCAIDRLAFEPPRAATDLAPSTRPRAKNTTSKGGVRVLYVSPLKALGVDVERNLRAPLAGIAAASARLEVPFRVPTVGVRTGDTPASERAKQSRNPPDIFITTPESLYLWLTSDAAAGLAGVELVIVDEVHALLPTKRGAHLAVSLERLERLRPEGAPPLQRIGLSATQRPHDEVARFLGGYHVEASGEARPREVEVVDATAPRALDLSVELPVEDRLGELGVDFTSGPAAIASRSIWPAIYPRLVELVRAHRSTLVFTNSRRLAERIALAINEVAGEELARAHHGSVSREERLALEERLKAGELPALVATSSLELGIDMGAVDLVVQIEAPTSVAAGLQRVGRAGHYVGGTSKGVVFPKFRADLLACAAVTERMREGLVEATRYLRNPLDVAAQQLVALAATGLASSDELYRTLRGAAPLADLPRDAFEGLVELATGRFPTHDLSDLRPSLTRDASTGAVRPRAHAKRLAVLNGGTIPERGLYGVFLSATHAHEGRARRVGELDEEMVLESRPGDVFVLGASAWRIDEITHDRVLVSPAPGEGGKTPFWRGDGLGRSFELGLAIGELTRALVGTSRSAATERLVERASVTPAAAEALVDWIEAQREETGAVPDDRTIVVERFRDEIGDWRVCVLTPFGARVHAPWAMAVEARLAAETPGEVEAVWSDDGFAFRLPDRDAVPDLEALFPEPDAIEGWVTTRLPETSVFAARFRENAARSLLLPRRSPTRRTPLWALRKRAHDLLSVAIEHPSFPVLLETYRECLRDVFDLPALTRCLDDVRCGRIAVVHAETRRASPFAASLLFSYVQSFLYDGDTPAAERRARALTIDHARLRSLLGESELRELFEPSELDALERRLQRREPRAKAKEPEALHDLVWSLGDLTRRELHDRIEDDPPHVEALIDAQLRARRIVEVSIAGEPRLIAVEDAGRYRDALGVVPPPGTPVACLAATDDPLVALVRRYARTHGPFDSREAARRFGTGASLVDGALARLAREGRVVLGAFRPGARGIEACDTEVLRQLKRTALARLRREVEPVPHEVWVRYRLDRAGLPRPRRGIDGLLDVIERLQGVAVAASVLEHDVLPARVADYTPSMLDTLLEAGEVVWRGVLRAGTNDLAIALFLTDDAPWLAAPPRPVEGATAGRIQEALATQGALRFGELVARTGGFAPEIERALWELVAAGIVTNDGLAPVRSRLRAAESTRATRGRRAAFTSRRVTPPGTEGRWSLAGPVATDETRRRASQARVALEREGVLVREQCDDFSALYPILKAMEDAGQVRRGFFVEALGAAQFASHGAEERLRALREPDPRVDGTFVLAATDPASPFGAALAWPAHPTARPARAAGAHIVIDRGSLVAWLGRRGRALSVWLPDEGPERARVAVAVCEALGRAVDSGRLPPLSLEAIDDGPAVRSALVQAFVRAGFVVTANALLRRRVVVAPPARAGAFDHAANDALDEESRGDARDEDFDDGLDHDPDDPLAPVGLDDAPVDERDAALPDDVEGPR